MLVLTAWLSADQHRGLVERCGPDHSLEAIVRTEELVREVHRRPVDALIIPGRTTNEQRLTLRSLGEAGLLPPLVVLSRYGEERTGLLETLREAHPTEVLLEAFDGDPDRLRAFLVGLPPATFRVRLGVRLARHLARLPSALRVVIEYLFEDPSRVSDTPSLARVAGLSRRTADRWIRVAGFSSPHILVVSPRLCNAYYYLASGRYPRAAVARSCGLGSFRSVRRLLCRVSDTRTIAEAIALPPDVFVARIAAALLVPSGGDQSSPHRGQE